MHLIAGLGNPGPRYRKNRHNVGFMLVDRIAQQAGKSFDPVYSKSLACSVERAGDRVILAKPQTFMNRSGEAVVELLRRNPVDPAQVLIVYDEVALPLGKIRIRRCGSSGGQKGMESIIQALGTEDVPRLRIGISPGELPEDYPSYVLSNFEKDEEETLAQVLDRAAQAIDVILTEGLERAMALHN